ncbi:MAG: A/G-specific adenine glycosylase [Proteobacteria bacterium]|nr:A/G-specific adenine glycosylase [Pseudomonadota bacterium]
MPSLSERLLAWFDSFGRHDLPWQVDRTPYSVWVSEIMLQQTQVATVIPYFERFISQFTSVSVLAAAAQDGVLHLWSGLGYYARGRNLHRAAQMIVANHNGELPRDIETLLALPGIGRSTAGAILALSHGDRHPILDGNVKRVLARFHEVSGWTGEEAVQKKLWLHAETHTPNLRVAAYTQAIMDLGATLCVRSKPDCGRCPLHADCRANAHGTQSQFPESKPRKPLPQKYTRFLLVKLDGQLLLRRRPPVGIWGGLWCFPEIDDDDEVGVWCERHGLTLTQSVVEQSPFAHTFTHFRLSITPLECVVKLSHPSVMDSDEWLWYNTSQPVKVGLAKPVSKLLADIANPNNREDTL